MPTNESIVAVPITVEEKGQLRQFLVRLVEQLDIVLGYRGNDPYVSISQLQSATHTISNELTGLEKTVLDIVINLFTSSSETTLQLLTVIVDELTEYIESLQSPNTVGDNDASSQTISNPPTQAEVQSIQNQVVANANDFNDLLIALRGTGIIAT